MFTFSPVPLPIFPTIIESFKLFAYALGKVWHWSLLASIIAMLPGLANLISNQGQPQGLEPSTNAAFFNLLNFVYSAAVSSFFALFITHRIYNLVKDEKSNAKASLGIAREKWLQAFIAKTILALLIIFCTVILFASLKINLFLSMLLFLGLGFIFIHFFLYIPTILFDHKSAFGALQKSCFLTWGSWWKIIVLCLPPSLIFFLLFSLSVWIQGNSIIGLMLSSMVIIIILRPFFYSIELVLFNNLRLEKNEKGLA